MKLACWLNVTEEGRVMIILPDIDELDKETEETLSALLSKAPSFRREFPNNDHIIFEDSNKACIFRSEWHWKTLNAAKAEKEAAEND